jgi:aspartokinase
MKALTALLIAVGLTTAAHAQYVVTNPISDVLDEVMHVEDIAKTVEMINNQVQQINALTQQLQQIQAYVKAFGESASPPPMTVLARMRRVSIGSRRRVVAVGGRKLMAFL